MASPNKPGGSVRLRVARFQDYQQIALLEARYGLGELAGRSFEKWIHLWQGNPAYQADWKIGWVLEAANGQIVGSMGNIPLLYELGGKRIPAASGRGWVAEPAYRSASLLLLEHLINQRGVDLFINNTVNASSVPGIDLYECQRVPVGLWDELAGWITSYLPFFAGVLAMKNYPGARPLSYPLSAAFFLRDRFKRSAVRESDVEISSCPRFDDRFDTFWMDLRIRHPELLLAVRTSETLQWHFNYGLMENRVWIATIMDGSRLAAYAIFDRKDNFGLKRMRLVDFQSLGEGAGLLFPILAWALKKCRAEGVHVLTHVGRYLDEPGFTETASFRRKLPSWTFYYRATDPALVASLGERRAWAPSLFDGDASL